MDKRFYTDEHGGLHQLPDEATHHRAAIAIFNEWVEPLGFRFGVSATSGKWCISANGRLPGKMYQEFATFDLAFQAALAEAERRLTAKNTS